MVETLASIGVFALVVLGIVPLMLTAMRGVDLSRRSTVAKTLAQQAMERARGLPFFVSYASQSGRVDVLDLYLPAYQSSGVYTTVCQPSSTEPGCPANIPQGYTVTFEAAFVEGTVGATGTEVFQTVVPPTTYAWNSSGSADSPAADLVELSIAVSWTQGGKPREFELNSIVGDRKFTEVRVSGSARVDHGVRLLTQFSHPSYRTGISSASVTDGNIDAAIESRQLSSARLSLTAGDLRIDDVVGSGGTAGESIASAEGATSEMVAPPSRTGTTTTKGAVTMTHPGVAYPVSGVVAGADSTSAEDLRVSVTDELPIARGTYRYSKESNVRDLWSFADLEESDAVQLRLDYTKPMAYSRAWNDGASVAVHKGQAIAETTALTSADRKVRTYAATEARYISVLPTSYITPSNQGSYHSVLVVDSFTASADCKATGSAATASSSVQWDATLRYYKDSNTLDGIPSGGYQTLVLDETSNVAGIFAGLNNPLVYDSILPLSDIYLFDDPSTGKTGYFRSIVGGTSQASTADGGRIATANLASAIVLETRNLDPASQDSTMSLSLGSLSCDAVDRR